MLPLPVWKGYFQWAWPTLGDQESGGKGRSNTRAKAAPLDAILAYHGILLRWNYSPTTGGGHRANSIGFHSQSDIIKRKDL